MSEARVGGSPLVQNRFGTVLGALASGLVVLVTLLLAAPIFFVFADVFRTSEVPLSALLDTVLPRYIANTFGLVIGTGIGVLVLGVGTAWLVSTFRFPGARIFEWALVLPLAIPAYVLAYAYTDFLQHSGPVQSGLRDLFGWGPRDYWFPNIRSLPGAIMIFSFVLYPYVYMFSRVAFLEQSAQTIEASRTLGCSLGESFWRVVLPMARPAIVAGLSLALMETLADFGTVSHFSVQTFTTGIYDAWFSYGDITLAGKLASALLLFVFTLILLERLNRSPTAATQKESSLRPFPKIALSPLASAGAFFACAVPVTIGFLLPIAILLHLNAVDGHQMFGARYITLTLNTVTLASITALLAVGLGLLMTFIARMNTGTLVQKSLRLAALGYAVPGSIIAVGVLFPLTTFDNAVDGFAEWAFGVSTGLLLTGSIAGVIYAYLVRFMAIPLGSIEASLQKVSPNMDAAARTLGSHGPEMLRRVHLPLVSGSLLTAGLIVFVDVVKELPATLILRPFNFDTLAIQAYRLASDERLAEASTASLVIVAVGILPVILLTRAIAKSRVGG